MAGVVNFSGPSASVVAVLVPAEVKDLAVKLDAAPASASGKAWSVERAAATALFDGVLRSSVQNCLRSAQQHSLLKQNRSDIIEASGKTASFADEGLVMTASSESTGHGLDLSEPLEDLSTLKIPPRRHNILDGTASEPIPGGRDSDISWGGPVSAMETISSAEQRPWIIGVQFEAPQTKTRSRAGTNYSIVSNGSCLTTGEVRSRCDTMDTMQVGLRDALDRADSRLQMASEKASRVGKILGDFKRRQGSVPKNGRSPRRACSSKRTDDRNRYASSPSSMRDRRPIVRRHS